MLAIRTQNVTTEPAAAKHVGDDGGVRVLSSCQFFSATTLSSSFLGCGHGLQYCARKRGEERPALTNVCREAIVRRSSKPPQIHMQPSSFLATLISR